jgi:hypothetical protein
MGKNAEKLVGGLGRRYDPSRDPDLALYFGTKPVRRKSRIAM